MRSSWADRTAGLRHDTAGITGPHHAAALQTARDAALGRLLTFSAGLFAAGALVYTARNFSLSREGQVTDRYTKAIEELGSGALDVRIGGIYALERVARDSSKDHPTVMEVLSAFVREHSHETTDEQHSRERGPAEGMRPDVQAAVTVIGRRDHKRDIQSVDLSRANLYGAYLSRANLSEVNLSRANLSRANLHLANLSRANLYGADLTGAHLGYADLSNANLQSADLTGADPHDANLSNANLTGAIWPDGAAVPDGWQRSDSGLLRGG